MGWGGVRRSRDAIRQNRTLWRVAIKEYLRDIGGGGGTHFVHSRGLKNHKPSHPYNAKTARVINLNDKADIACTKSAS